MKTKKAPYSTFWAVEMWDGFACNWRIEDLDHISYTMSGAKKIQNKVRKETRGFPPTRVVRYVRDPISPSPVPTPSDP